MTPKTLYQKIWDSHVVHEQPGQPAIIYIDRHLIHEGTSPQAFAGLRAEGRKVRRPDLTFAVMDHSVSTTDRTLPILDNDAKLQFDALEKNCRESGGEAIRALSMDGRMTVCNMSIEGGARAGMIAPDETTFAYLEGRPFVSRGKAFQEVVERWKALRSDDGAKFDMTIELHAEQI